MSEIKYIVYPGTVRSRHDQDEHFITGRRLLDLYKVDWREAVIVNTGDEVLGLHWEFLALHPDPFGNYSLDNCSPVVL